MARRPRRIAAIGGAAALLAVAGCGSDSNGQSQSTRPGAGPPSRSAGAPPAGPAGPGAADLSALANRLGVSATELRRAMAATRPAGRSPGRPSTDPAAALAKELGLTPTKVRAALRLSMPRGGARPGARVTTVPPATPS